MNMEQYRGLRLAALCMAVLVACGTHMARAQSATDVARRAFGAVVLIDTEDAQGRPLSLGSGFVVRPGVVVTNVHVVEGASKGYAKLVGQSAIFPIEGAIGIDSVHDIVILKAAASASTLMPLASASPEVGETVYAVGNPRGLEGTFSQGIVSAIRDLGNNDRLIQITAPISPGSSGGPVLNTKGEVVGIAVATFGGGQNLNFAIPATYLRPLLDGPQTVTPLGRANTSTKGSAISSIGGPATEGVAVTNFLWEGGISGTLDSNGNFTCSVRNNAGSAIKNVNILVVFHDADGAIVDVSEVRSYGVTIGSGLARRLGGNVDPSVKRYTTPISRANRFVYSDQPNTRVEYRVLGFEFVD